MDHKDGTLFGVEEERLHKTAVTRCYWHQRSKPVWQSAG